MANYRLFPTVDGPSSAISYSGPFAAGVGFQVTSGGMWFEGYWWWVCATGQPTAPQTFALWQVYGQNNAKIISAATVTSGTLTAGQWNYIPLAQPIMLSIGGGANFTRFDGGGPAIYVACTSFTGGFPDTNAQFGSGDTYSGGITNGPLTAFSDQGGTLPGPWNLGQGLFSTNTVATANCPFGVSNSANFWMDVQVSDTAPGGYSGSYRIWPNFPLVQGQPSNDENQQTTATEFWLSESCSVDNIWFWSPAGAANLPSRCGIFNVSTLAVVAGSDNTSPAWVNTSGAAASPGDGWISCSYAGSGLTLPAGKYKVAIYSGGGGIFYQEDIYYFGTGPGANNIVNGPITVPNVANAATAFEGEGPIPGAQLTGNSIYQIGPWACPVTFDSVDKGETRWVDIEVTPVAQGTPTPTPTPTPTAVPTPTPTPTPTPVATNPGGFLSFFVLGDRRR